MCGICGAVQVRGASRRVLDVERLNAMTDAMTHRGPNDRGIHLADRIAIGVRRLSIVDVDGGHQPFSNEDGTVIAAQNGELYNHEEVRRELAAHGHAFHSRCDTEILPHLYEAAGDSMPEQLHGMFAFVVWDSARRRAVLARDRLGIKPLYYAEVDDLLLFASELKSLLASGLVPLDVDPVAVELYLSLGFVPGPRTLLRNVRKLLPGHRLVVESSRTRVEQYWAYPEPAPVSGRSEDEWTEELLALLEDSVRVRLMSDVPLGAMLSGGLDSSIVVALMARHMTRPVKTFAVGFAGAPGNELESARRTAAALGAEHHELELTLDDPIDLDALVWSLDEPVADLSSIGFSALSELTARHVTVALSGQGADELLAGYERYRQSVAVDRFASAPGPIRGAMAAIGRFGPGRVRKATRAAAAADPIVEGTLVRSEWRDALRTQYAQAPLRELPGDPFREALTARLGNSSSRGLSRALLLDGQLTLVDDMLHYFDRTSMAHSLEVRVPFLDHRFVELCARVPASLKLKNGQTKYVLRRAARGLVPDEVLDRPKIGFFSTALGTWFGSQISGVVGEVLLDPGARYQEFVDRRGVEALVAHAGGYRRSRLLLSVLLLELWLARFVPRATTALARARVA